MAIIPRAALKYLTDEINAVSGVGQAQIRAVLDSLDWSDVSEARAQLVSAMQEACATSADTAAVAAAEFYDEVRRLADIDDEYAASPDPARDPAATEGAVRALVSQIVGGGPTGSFNRDVLDRVDYETKRAANECVVSNARRDPAKPRYARVPTGAETCSFCMMLASRGFVYTSSVMASHAHSGCDCRVVQGYPGMSVEGYDTQELYGRYVQALEDGSLKLKTVNGSTSHVLHWSSERFRSYGDFSRFVSEATDVEDLQLRLALAEQEWGRTGLSDKYRKMLAQTARQRRYELAVLSPDTDPGPIYEKPRDLLEKYEQKGVDWLWNNGIRPVVKLEDPTARANFDFEIDGEPWEMKNVTNDDSSVSNQVKRARVKWFKLGRDDPMKCVITCEGCESDFDSVCSALERKRRDGERIIVLSDSGVMRRLE